MLPTILDMKNANKAQKNFQFSKSDRMTHFWYLCCRNIPQRYTLFCKQYFYKQRQAEIGKKSNKC